LIALGYTMVYGVLRFINFAHSDVFMVGAYAGFFIAPYFAPRTVTGGLAVLCAAMVICAILGVVIERLAYRPLRQSSKLNVLITAIGVSLLLENAAQLFWKATPRAFPVLFPTATYRFNTGSETVNQVAHAQTVTISSNQIIVLAVTLFLLIALQFLVFKTKMGKAMRAVSFNHTAASLVGISNDKVISFTFALGSALAAAGGILYAINYQSIQPLMGIMPGLKAFVAAVLGGIGNIPGAAVGGLILGIVETFVKGSPWSTFSDAIAFAVLILILVFRPAGLFGKVQVEKV
jgi:branched-chain amino acid transport system permease protein